MRLFETGNNCPLKTLISKTLRLQACSRWVQRPFKRMLCRVDLALGSYNSIPNCFKWCNACLYNACTFIRKSNSPKKGCSVVN